MLINCITYSSASLKCLRPFIVLIRKKYNEIHPAGWQYVLERKILIQMLIPVPLTWNWRSLNIYREDLPLTKKRKPVETLCDENFILYQKTILNKANNSNYIYIYTFDLSANFILSLSYTQICRQFNVLAIRQDIDLYCLILTKVVGGGFISEVV